MRRLDDTTILTRFRLVGFRGELSWTFRVNNHLIIKVLVLDNEMVFSSVRSRMLVPIFHGVLTVGKGARLSNVEIIILPRSLI